MEKMEFEVEAKELNVTSRNYYSIALKFVANGCDVLDHFEAKDVVRHFGKEILLDLIGEDEAKRYFGIE